MSDLKLTGFKVYEAPTKNASIRTYSRKDFYKICLLNGHSIIHYADRGIEIDGISLFFGNPHIPYSWQVVSETQTGYVCLFTEDFLSAGEHLQESPLFKIGGTPVFFPDQEQRDFLATIFKKMLQEQDTEYVFKKDLIRNYIQLIIHEAMKMQPTETFFKHKNAAERITGLFLELLERQFPIESTSQQLLLRSPQDFAKQLNIHVNSLNRSVKDVTGKPTSAHIAERVVAEAKALLEHTDWPVSDIAYSLGFEFPSYFNNYFKKISGTSPTAYRTQIV